MPRTSTWRRSRFSACCTLSEALDHLGDRLGLDEARSFATLIQQSDELGSSISDALRVYSEDMRHKRMSRAEEKAYALPAKLSVPMMVCIFPTLFVVILLPVIVRMSTGNWQRRRAVSVPPDPSSISKSIPYGDTPPRR